MKTIEDLALLGWDPEAQILNRLCLPCPLHGMPNIHHSDRGVQYAATEYAARLKMHQVKISMTARRSPGENAYAERPIRTIKDEEVHLSEHDDFADARSPIRHFIEAVYLWKRIHSSLGYLTPVEFEDVYWQNHLGEH